MNIKIDKEIKRLPEEFASMNRTHNTEAPQTSTRIKKLGKTDLISSELKMANVKIPPFLRAAPCYTKKLLTILIQMPVHIIIVHFADPRAESEVFAKLSIPSLFDPITFNGIKLTKDCAIAFINKESLAKSPITVVVEKCSSSKRMYLNVKNTATKRIVCSILAKTWFSSNNKFLKEKIAAEVEKIEKHVMNTRGRALVLMFDTDIPSIFSNDYNTSIINNTEITPPDKDKIKKMITRVKSLITESNMQIIKHGESTARVSITTDDSTIMMCNKDAVKLDPQVIKYIAQYTFKNGQTRDDEYSILMFHKYSVIKFDRL